MRAYRAAALQMTSVPDLDKNLAQAEELIDLAVRQGAELVTLPENFSFLGDEDAKIAQADIIYKASEEFLKTMARRYQVTLIGGGYPVPAKEGKVFNTALMVSPDGQELMRYEKVHLFDVDLPDGNTYRESNTVISGHLLPDVFPSKDFGMIGLVSLLRRAISRAVSPFVPAGAEVIVVPAAFTAFTGKDHWQVLLQARAIENTCYIIAPAQTGFHNARRQSHGHAMIIDPWGMVLADAGVERGVAIAEINPSRLSQVRRQMPALAHRMFL
jgi:predicted amidohydrolase